MLIGKDVFSSSYGHKDNIEQDLGVLERLCIREGPGRVHGHFEERSRNKLMA